MARLKPLRKDADIAAIPASEPVLVELEPAPSGFVDEQEDGKAETLVASDGNEPDPAVKALQEQLDAAKAAEKIANDRLVHSERERQDALRLANERGEQASRSIAERDQSERDLINGALTAAQGERDAAKAALKSAYTAGDPDGIADAQDKISRAAAKIVNLEGAAAEFARRAEEETKRPRQEQQRQPQLSVVEAIEQNPNLLPKEKVWLKEHPELIADNAANAELGVGYNRAVKAGHVRGTDGYFQFLDEFLGYKKAQAKEIDIEQQGSSIVAAPVSRQSPQLSGGRVNGNQVHLSPEQRTLASSMGLTDRAYAAQVLRLEQAKRDDPERYPSRRS